MQALLQIVISYPLLLELAASTLFQGTGGSREKPLASHAAAVTTAAAALAGFRDRVNMCRRILRVFRFVESFYLAHQLFSGLMGVGSAAGKRGKKASPNTNTAAAWIDAFARAFAALYLLLESLTIVDCLDVPGLAVWGPATAHMLNVEGQRYWFLSLACSVAASLARILRVTRDVPMPAADQGAEHDHLRGSPLGGGEEADADDNEDEKGSSTKAARLEEERMRLRAIVQARAAQRRTWQRALGARVTLLARRAVTDAIDLLLPGAIVGWTPLHPGSVGVVMCVTTLLTGEEVWRRCGREAADAAERKEAKERAEQVERASKVEKEKAGKAE